MTLLQVGWLLQNSLHRICHCDRPFGRVEESDSTPRMEYLDSSSASRVHHDQSQSVKRILMKYVRIAITNYIRGNDIVMT